jgi:hypothetical protein
METAMLQPRDEAAVGEPVQDEARREMLRILRGSAYVAPAMLAMLVADTAQASICTDDPTACGPDETPGP